MRQAVTRSPNGPPAFRPAQQPLLSAFRGGRAFLPAVLKIMSSAGNCYAPVRPLRYPRDAGHRDLTRIGRDMYRAMGRYADETFGG